MIRVIGRHFPKRSASGILLLHLQLAGNCEFCPTGNPESRQALDVIDPNVEATTTLSLLSGARRVRTHRPVRRLHIYDVAICFCYILSHRSNERLSLCERCGSSVSVQTKTLS